MEAGDDSMTAGVDEEYRSLAADYEQQRQALLFSGDYDESNAIISISAGAGGTEATDWAADAPADVPPLGRAAPLPDRDHRPAGR